MRKIPRQQRHKSVEEVLATVGLQGLGSPRIHELSDGQMERVALARVIVVEPYLLPLDEPPVALELKIRQADAGQAGMYTTSYPDSSCSRDA